MHTLNLKNTILIYLLIIVISIVIGFINTLVGSGSLVILPLLMSMGLPPHIANGTNRVAVLVQGIMGAGTFLRHKKVKIGQARWAITPCVLGAVLGAYLATQIDPQSLKRFIGVLMILMLFVILIKPKRWLKPQSLNEANNKKPLNLLIMFTIGVYGGFIQAGMGIFLLAGLVLGVGYNLTYANAVKLIIVVIYALPVLLIFIYHNQVNWFYGILTAIGQGTGAVIGAKFATQYKDAEVWVYRLLVLVILAAIIYFYVGRV